MKKNIIFCDVCGKQIGDEKVYPAGSIINMSVGNYQLWPIDGNILEICRDCCIVIATARHLGIVTYDENELYKRLGYVLENGLWSKK